MKKALTVLLFAIASCTPLSSALSLPGMTQAEVLSWSEGNYTGPADIAELAKIPPLQTTHKYEPDQSDLDVSFEALAGKVHFTIFLDQAEKVKTENIDYRPACYWTGQSDCTSPIAFEQATPGKGAKLIQAIWGQKVLVDFQTATLAKTHTDGNIYRWYQGQLYNYETFQMKGNTTVQFSVVSKDATQRDLIQQFMEWQRLSQ